MVSHLQNWKGCSLSRLDMSQWPATKAGKVLKALTRIGWTIKRETGGSHRILARPGWTDYVFAFHDGEEIGPRMLARIAKQTGLTPPDL
jgi:predicted RNA binding protein YcfA (HicA-like mRNA interferase family)